MIKLYDGQVTDLLQNGSRYNPEIMALSYAIRAEKQRLMALADQTRTLAMIERLPENILDVLAVELRTPYYSEGMTVEQKREIIKNTLIWFYRAGTPAAVKELIAAVFGEGRIVEWFDFTEGESTPGTFDIITNARLTEEIVDEFLRIIGQVKNTRSHLRRVLIERDCTMQERVASGAVGSPKTSVLNGGLELSRTANGNATAKAGTTSAPKECILNHAPAKNRSASAPITGGSGAITAPKEYVLNHVAAKERAASGATRIGVVLAIEGAHLVILNCPSLDDVQIGQPQGAYSATAASSIKITI